MILTPEQQQIFTMKMNEALDKQTMSWTSELREWHAMALRSLECASPVDLQIQSAHFGLLMQQQPEGINMNVVMILAACMERCSPRDLNLPLDRFAYYMNLNSKIQDRWNTLSEPSRKKILKEIELMRPAPRIIGASN